MNLKKKNPSPLCQFPSHVWDCEKNGSARFSVLYTQIKHTSSQFILIIIYTNRLLDDSNP